MCAICVRVDTPLKPICIIYKVRARIHNVKTHWSFSLQLMRESISSAINESRYMGRLFHGPSFNTLDPRIIVEDRKTDIKFVYWRGEVDYFHLTC